MTNARLIDMVRVATHYREKHVARHQVKVKETPKRFKIVGGLYDGEIYDKPTGKYIGAFVPLAMFRYHLEKLT